MKEEYAKADAEAKHWHKILVKEKDYTLNAIATIHYNAAVKIKNYLAEKYGHQELKKHD